MSGIKIPLTSNYDSRHAGGQPTAILQNFILEADLSGAGAENPIHIQRPGCTVYQIVASGTATRGLNYTQGLFGSLPVAAVGTAIYKFDGTTATSLGTIATGTDRVEFAPTNFGLAYLAANTLYFNNGTVQTTITIPDGKIPVSITSINSYVIVGCSDGTWYWVVPGDTTIDPLHFATAESMPDNLLCVRRVHDEVYMFGAQTTEVWQVTAIANIILQPAQGRRYDIGTAHRDTVQALDNTLYFVGSDGIVYLAGQVPMRVSTDGIEEAIRLATGTPSAFTFSYDGHSYYVLNLSGQGTFAFDVQNRNWMEFSSDQLTTGWLPAVACMVGNVAMFGASNSGKVLKADATSSSDDGTIFTRAVSGIVAFNGGRKRNDSLEVWTGGASNTPIRIRWRDGPDSSFGSYVTATAPPPDSIVRFTRLGSARQPYRCIEISCADASVISIHGAFANGGRAI